MTQPDRSIRPAFLLLLATFFCATAHASTPVALLEGKLSFELQDGFVPDKDRAVKQVIAGYKARKGGAWGTVTRSTQSLEPTALADYISRKAADYTKGLAWLPKLTWLKRETVTINGRPWADLRFIVQMDKPKGPHDGLLYTRILATSYGGQLLEIVFTSNTDKDPETKQKIDRTMESVRLAE
jgi:hypothetical protein